MTKKNETTEVTLADLIAEQKAADEEAAERKAKIAELIAANKGQALEVAAELISELLNGDVSSDDSKVDWSLFAGINFACNPVIKDGEVVGVDVTVYEQSAASASKRRQRSSGNGQTLSAPGTIARQQQDAYIASGGTISHRELAEKYFGKSPNVGQVFNNLRKAGLI